MKAVVLIDGKPVLKQVDVPKLCYGDVLIQMKACGLCGTDIEKIGGHYTASQPILGHEPTGVVFESLSADVKVGQRVFAHHHVPCYECYYCLNGSPTMCAYYRKTNLDPGGFAEYFRVPEFNVSRGAILELPSHVSFEEGCFVEPLATVLRAQKRALLKKGESVFVVGAGPMGDLHIMVAKHFGASQVFASDLSQTRLDFASKIGADYVFSAQESPEKEVIKLTDGRGADLSIVASGSPKAVVSALRATRKGGRVLLFGVPYKGSFLEYDLSELLNNELSVIPSNAAVEEDTRSALRLIAQAKINVSKLVSKLYTLDEFEKAVEDSLAGRVIKAIIVSEKTKGASD
ncbi:alcohol dehydrogenase [Candidatus Marsarchaeota G2 archaeon ECH_B_SAG-F08]|uniref:Alcohol dehydrogenase n=1 Tax=Candidatus Marsarchaeota G2 archaeon ECH_B_SAG-F08 TaxID=1978165 RepID=A0A2R6BJ01_9ARCH|nr:MAG: alcohol dehydrogenase [Candidatus Marsarchaeota G2 archaeon ECH_B_SAG-F08]